ncbi:MAG: efflux RND transporter permease subunit [Candidatus Omnitrophica bacterium]|nr:efflux RND transporter permease subunit [Candidatus Omnitrophota bacterium]
MKLAEFSVKQSLFINLLSVFVIIAGCVAAIGMSREAFPNISFDRIMVTTAYPGASAEEVEKLVTIPLEKELNEVDDVEEMRSSSIEGLSTIVIKLEADVKNKDDVVNDIQKAVDRVKNLPKDIYDDPLVADRESKHVPMIGIALSGQLEEKAIQRIAEDLEDEILDVDGVATIRRYGWRDQEMWVEVDPDKLREYHMSTEEIMESLKRRNISIPGGSILHGSEEFNIRTTGEFYTKEEIEKVVIRANDTGNWIRVSDVASVKDTFHDEDLINKAFGTRCVYLLVIKKGSADAIDVVSRVKEVVDDFEKKQPAELKLAYVDDLSFYIKRRLSTLGRNGIIGFILVVVSLLTFLNRRVALVTALGIPIAFLATFIVMSFLGYSINLITMFGLIVVLGMLVDDGIIIAENCYRYMEGGMPPREAAIVGTQEVIKPVTATILTTMATYTPLMMMTGILGQFIKYIPIVIVIALAASMFEAFIILPSHIADFVKIKKDKTGKVFSKKNTVWFQKLLGFYTRLLTGAITRRYRVCIGVFLTFLVCLVLAVKVMPFELFSSRGVEIFFVRGEAKIGTPLSETNRYISKVEDEILRLPKKELDTFITQVGMIAEDPDSPHVRRGSHLVQIVVYLTPEGGRKRSASEIIDDIRAKTKDIKGFERLYYEKVRHGPPVGKPVAIKIRGEHHKTMEEIAGRFKTFLGTIRGVSDVNDDYQLGKEEIMVVVDEDAATNAYLTVGEVAGSVRNAFEGGIATSIKREKAAEEIDVLVRFPEDVRNSLEAFDKILIPNKFGNLIPLNRIASFERRRGVFAIGHLDGKKVINVSADVDTEIIKSVEANRIVMNKFKTIEEEYPGYAVKYGGEQEETAKSMRSLSKAFILAFILVFMILATNFKSLVQPLVVMVAIPFGIIGVVIMFLFHREPFSFLAIIGIVGLSGVVVNDSIVLVDFINRLREKGIDRRHSIIEAGQLRLRPVILTTITTVLGLMPVAYGIGGSDPILIPMALAMCWGLAFSTALTLIVIPCIYAIIDDIALKVTHRSTVLPSENKKR